MNKIKTVILSGGIGYRLKEETEFKPKPMVEVGGKPILWHILKTYTHYGFDNFIIALGYKGNLIKDYFVNKKYYDGDFTLNTSTHKINHKRSISPERMKITFVDTGLDSSTGERVRRIKNYIDSDYFMVTYGDGVSDINIKDLLNYHKAKKVIGTVTGVYPQLKYGGLEDDGKGLVRRFERRTKLKQMINGGFMVFKKSVFNYIKKDSMIEDVFDPLIANKQLALYKHQGFFKSMDTYQDMQDLNEMWKENPAWKIWH